MSDEPAPLKRAGNRGLGRRPLLAIDPRIETEILKAVAIGTPDKYAFEAAGVSSTAVYNWIALGTDDPGGPDRPPRKGRSPYREFVAKLQKARSEFVRNGVLNLHRAGEGTVTTVTINHPDGRVETRVERKGDGDWKATKHLLAIRDPENFSERYRVEHSGPAGAPLPSGTEQVAAALRALPTALRDALAGVGDDDLAPDTEAE